LSRNLDKNVFIEKKPSISQGLPVRKKKLLAADFVSVLFLIAIAEACFVKFAQANPHLYEQVSYPVSPPPEVEPLSISILSPKNDTVVISGNVSLNFKVRVVIPVMPELFYYYLGLSAVYYKASWLPNTTYLNLTTIKNSIPDRTRIFSNDSVARWGTHWTLSGYELNPNFSIDLTGIPEGPQSIEVFAVESGSRKYSQSGITICYGRYTLVTSSIVHFTVDNISTWSPQNKTYDTSDIPLLFKVHDSFTQISYSLDGQDKVMVSGNTTLIDLPNGYHNVTVYATDEAENTGASKTIIFTIAEPQSELFPTTLVIASLTSVAVAIVGLLFYFKKRKR
jgi:hypothetical protein